MPKGHWKCMGNITPRKIVFLTVNIFAVQEYCSGIPEAEIFGRKRKFSAFGLRFRPPNLKAGYGRISNFRVFSKKTFTYEVEHLNICTKFPKNTSYEYFLKKFKKQ